MQEFLAFDQATATGTKRIGLRGFDTVEIEVYGTATSATVKFKGAGKSGVDRDRMGVNMADFSTALSAGMGQVFQLNIGGLDSLLLEVSAVSGGNVSVNVRCLD